MAKAKKIAKPPKPKKPKPKKPDGATTQDDDPGPGGNHPVPPPKVP